MLGGMLGGVGGVAALDAGATTLTPIVSFLPILYYIGAGLLMAAIAGASPRRWWRVVGLAGALIGAVSVGWLATRSPRWDTHAGWQHCRHLAGPWYARSVVPVAVPGCSVLMMCANESGYAMGALLDAQGCPAP